MDNLHKLGGFEVAMNALFISMYYVVLTTHSLTIYPPPLSFIYLSSLIQGLIGMSDFDLVSRAAFQEC